MPSCTNCPGSIPDGAMFCPTCGTRSDAHLAQEGARETRRVVTILFADLVGSTGIAERLDPEVVRTVQSRMFATLRETIERHGGIVEKFIGDAVMAVFGLPSAHEDDALRAVLAASEFGPALEAQNRELTERRGLRLELRVGINTGEVVASEGARDGASDGALVTGDAVNVAARLQQHATPGEVLLGLTTFRLVESFVSTEPVEGLSLRGRTASVSVHRLRSVAPVDERTQRTATPLLARERELGILEGEFERARQTQTCRLVTIVAPAGVGKSRLVREFQARVADHATILRGRCLSYGDGITFWPMAQIVRQAIGQPNVDAEGDVRARLETALENAARSSELARVLAALLGQEGTVGSAEEFGWAIRRFLAHVAQERPLVVVVEDIHWAEAGLLDVLEAIVDWTRDAPILILCPARPEVLEMRPTLVAGRDNASLLRLAPLATADTGTLIDALPGGVALPPALRRRIEEVAEGIPLFVEEMLGMLVDDGRLRRDGEDWVAAPGLDSVAVPVSVQALIAARIDALAAGERGVAERASVVGREFERSAVASLVTEDREPLAARLLSLSRKELIEPTEPGLGGDDAFRFRHILIRDAAYERLPKRERATLHARLADWLEEIAAGGRVDFLEIVGHHLAEAVRYRAEIGLDRDATLVERAVATLADAAARADRGHRNADATELWLRVLAIIDEDARDADDRAARAHATRLRAAESAHLAGRADLAVSLMEAAIAGLAERDDRSALASAHERLGTYLLTAGHPDRALDAYRHVLSLEPEPSLQRARGLASLGRLLMLRDRDADAKAVLEEALELPAIAGSESTRASAMTSLGTILNFSGAWEEGIDWLRRGLELARSVDDGFEIMRAYNNLAGALERAGEIAASVALFQEGYADGERRQLSTHLPLMLSNLSFNLLLMGRVAEAEARARQAFDHAPAPAFVSDLWDRLGWAHLVAGRIEGADEALQRAEQWAERHPGMGLHMARFERHMGFGRVHAAADRFDAADAKFREALPRDLTGFPLAALPDLVAEATGNRANQAARLRAANDDAGATAAASSAGQWRQDFTRLWPTDVEPSPRVQPFLAIIDAEVERAAGRSNPEAWARVIELAQRIEMRLAEVYARFRYAEALAMAARPPDEVAGAVGAALDQSRELGTGLYTVQIEALAERLGISKPER